MMAKMVIPIHWSTANQWTLAKKESSTEIHLSTIYYRARYSFLASDHPFGYT
jgi:hypothetical protein